MAYDFEWAIHFVIQTFGVQRDVAVNVVTDAFDIVTFGTPLGLLIGLFYRQLSKIGANGLRRARQNISLAVASIAMTLAHAFSRLRAIGAFAQGDEAAPDGHAQRALETITEFKFLGEQFSLATQELHETLILSAPYFHHTDVQVFSAIQSALDEILRGVRASQTDIEYLAWPGIGEGPDDRTKQLLVVQRAVARIESLIKATNLPREFHDMRTAEAWYMGKRQQAGPKRRSTR